uniref:RNA-directed DNA polymerase from mobile element jockey n=1 Tax=Schizaphis graminum TaxID=13262 RepID=A0A2S2P0Y0_SCHGA
MKVITPTFKTSQPKIRHCGRLQKKLLNHKQPPPPIRNSDNTWATSDTEKANVFASHLANVFKPHDISPNQTQLTRIEQSLNSPLPMALPAKHTSPGEVMHIIKKLPTRKAPGHDLISNFIVKNLPNKAVLFLTLIFNSLLRLSYFPSIWKHSNIILISKPDKPPQLPTSYRPISLLPTFSKMFEKILLKRLLPLSDKANIIPHHQFGFRAKHSTTHQLLRTVDLISTSMESKHYCAAVLLDVAQAFDRVWHDGLLYKLKKFLTAPYYLIIKSYLENRTFSVRVNYSYSVNFPILAGVPQGSDIAPFLYTIFAHDIPKTLHTSLGTYADDTIILASNDNPQTVSDRLQNHLNIIQIWSKKWKIKINDSKSSFITFSLRPGDCPPVSFNNNLIPTTPVVKYLGLTFDKRLTWAQHLKNKRKSVNSRLHLLRPLLRSKLNISNKLLIYKAILRPVWAYGIQIWGSAKSSNLRTIQAFQSICLRQIVSAPWYIKNANLHKDLKVPTLSHLTKSRFLSFHSKLTHHTNPLIKRLSSRAIPDNPHRRLKRSWPRDLLA